MKNFIIIMVTAMASLLNVNGADAQHKVLVAYFSATGTTKAVAENLSSVLKSDLYAITPKDPYTSADLNWNNKQSRSSKEESNAKARPALADKNAKIANYDVIFLGFPIWWGKAPKVVNTFLESYDFSGKTIILFATSGGSELGSSASYLKGSCSKTTVIKNGKLLNGSPSQQELTTWVKSLKY